jgi:hypothetical protein
MASPEAEKFKALGNEALQARPFLEHHSSSHLALSILPNWIRS